MRQRKDADDHACYSSRTMDHQPFSPKMLVSEALETQPAVARVFIRHRTACVGCSLARFCSLQDVARTYGLSLEALLAEMRQVSFADSSNFIGANHENSE